MLKIEANTLEEAYEKASKKLNKSIVDLDIEILQSPSKGFLGFAKKKAIINIKNFQETKDDDLKIIGTIKEKIIDLFSSKDFNIEVKKVEKFDEKTVLIEFDGDDAALLIGKEGYRYKALSYLLYNWINNEYALKVRLEIASFLKNQEEHIFKYLKYIDEIVKEKGFARTKILDGILIKIVLKELRNRYPNKYVFVKTNREGLKYIIIK